VQIWTRFLLCYSCSHGRDFFSAIPVGIARLCTDRWQWVAQPNCSCSCTFIYRVCFWTKEVRRSRRAVTKLRDALLSTALYVCFACAVPVLSARYQRKEAQKIVQITTSNDANATAVLSMVVPFAGVGRVESPERETMLQGARSAAASRQIAPDSACRRSPRLTTRPATLLDAVDAYVAPIPPLRNVTVAYERKAVTAEMRAIGLRPDGKQMLLYRVLASRALRLLKKFRQGYCPLIGQTFSSCDPVPPALRAQVRIEVHQKIANLPWLHVGQQGTITSVRKGILYMTLDAPQAPLQVTTVMTAAATLLGMYTGPPPVPLPPPLPHGKIHLSVEQQSSVREICEMRMWRVHEISLSACWWVRGICKMRM